MDAREANSKDCVACKIVGVGATTTVGTYALFMSRTRAPGTLLHKRIMAGFGLSEFCSTPGSFSLIYVILALIAGGALRWFK